MNPCSNKIITSRGSFYLTVSIALSTLVSFLYFPFLSSDLVFDDHGLFSGGIVFDYALIPFDFRPRTFPYFTLGFIQLLHTGVEANRIFNLALHIACSTVLFLLLRSLIELAIKANPYSLNNKKVCIQLVAVLGTFWFAIDPVAVYGVGYLVQRTILFATLFSLLSLWFFCRAFSENRTADIVTAAVFYSMAVFSKEHAIMLPLTMLAVASMYDGDFRSHFKRILLYLLLCAPAAVTVFLSAKHVVSISYEPDVAAMITKMHEISIMTEPWGQWIVSIVMQTSFFFDYPAFWLVPDVSLLSADMRFDFVRIWFSWWIWPKAILFFLSPILAIYFLRRKGLASLFCSGFLYCWILFLTELAAVRFQEPFVLYRSYLWAPGYIMMMVAIFARMPFRWLVAGAIPLFLVFFILARDRLTSLETESSVWKDAANKLTSPYLIGSDRIFYNRGRAYLQEKKYADAIADFSQVIQLSPTIAQAYYNRALAFYSLKKDSEALQDLNFAASIIQNDGSIQYLRGMVFERNSCIFLASRAYSESLKLGHLMAKMKLEKLAKKTLENEKYLSPDVTCPV